WGTVVGTSGTILRGVSALASNDVWLAGFDGVYHWDGSTVSQSYQTTIGEALYDITAVAHNDVWAAGIEPIISAHTLHWNGSQWSSVQTPHIGQSSRIFNISAIDSSHIWAVGESVLRPTTYVLALRWDGIQWTNESPNLENA